MMLRLVRHVHALLPKINMGLQATVVIAVSNTDSPNADCLQQQLSDCTILVLYLPGCDADLMCVYLSTRLYMIPCA